MKHSPSIIREINHRDQLPDFLNRHGLTGFGVEIGTFTGTYAAHLLDHWRGSRLFCVDPWARQDSSVYRDSCNDYDLDGAYHHCVNTIGRNPRCQLMRFPSLAGARNFADGSVDFAFLDGNHSFEAVTADRHAWWPKIRRGGVLGFHDCYCRLDDANSNSLDAILDFADQIGVRPHVTWCTSAWFYKE